MKPFGNAYKNAVASNGGDFKRLPAGGYIVEITDVEAVPDKEYLKVVYDIAEGEFKGFYGDDWHKDKPNTHADYFSWKDTANRSGMDSFKTCITCIDESNGTNFNGLFEGSADVNERLLIGKRYGVIIELEEYETNRGTIATRPHIKWRRSTKGLQEWLDKVKNGTAQVPPLKKLEQKTTASPETGSGNLPDFQQITDDDIPF